LHTLRLIARQPPLASLACVRLTGWPVISTVGSIVGSIVKNQCLHNLTVNPTVQPTVESTVEPTVHPTVRSVLKVCKFAITLVGKLPVITGKTA